MFYVEETDTVFSIRYLNDMMFIISATVDEMFSIYDLPEHLKEEIQEDRCCSTVINTHYVTLVQFTEYYLYVYADASMTTWVKKDLQIFE